jgi:2-polyprenyl-3-methyl-5-hydroxy-6-metoxy-1,4-benzoquinol methylase
MKLLKNFLNNKMDYREKFYAKYISKNTRYLYGELSIKDIKKQFVVWDKYFGGFLPKNKKASIIELGCGNGGLVYWLQNIGYPSACGIDASPEQVEHAKSLGVKNITQANLIDFLKGKSDFYDVIFLRDVIEHFKKDEALEILDGLHKALKKGGMLIIQTPNAAGIFGSRYRYHDFTHESGFTENSLRQVLLMNNFSDLKFYETGPVIHGLKSFIRFVLWKFIKIGLRVYLLIETGSGKEIFTQNIIVSAKK